MKPSILSTITFASVLTTSLIATPAMAKSQKLSEASVKNFLNKTEALVKKQDANGFAQYLSDDIKINLTVNMNGQSMPLNLNKQQYIKQLKESFSQVSNYQYNLTVNNIRIDGDKAHVKTTMNEKMTISGMRMISKFNETSIIKVINGKLKITKIIGNGTVKIVQ